MEFKDWKETKYGIINPKVIEYNKYNRQFNEIRTGFRNSTGWVSEKEYPKRIFFINKDFILGD